MFRTTEREINLETAELDAAAHTAQRTQERESLMTPENNQAASMSSTLDSSSSTSSGEDEEAGAVQPLSGRGKGTLEIESSAVAHLDPAVRTQLICMWSLPNLALLMSYFAIGFAMTFTSTPLTAYAVSDLNVGPAELNITGTVLALPWSFKILYGLLSDCVPIGGKRRKPYFIIGWTVFVFANVFLAALGRPSLVALIALGFFGVMGYMLSDVMCDAIIVERSHMEPEGKIGHMQAVGYMARYVGNVVGATLGTILFNKSEWGWGLNISQIYMLNGLVAVVCVLPFTWHLSDPNHVQAPRGLKLQLADIWQMVQRRSIWVPMTFIAVYNMLMIPNAAWSNFLILGLHFSPWQLGLMFIIATVFSWLGITFYRTFLMKYSWRWVYVISTTLTVLFSIMQLCLVFRLNIKWGIPDLAFALGDDAVSSFVSAMQFLPTVTFYLGLCPPGAEGTSYSMLTTLSNVAGAIGSDIGTLMAGVWDVGNQAIESGDWSGIWKLTLLTSLIQPLGLCLLFLLPRDVAHQKAMQKCDKRSFWGGAGFLTFLVVAWSWTIIQTFVYLAKGSE